MRISDVLGKSNKKKEEAAPKQDAFSSGRFPELSLINSKMELLLAESDSVKTAVRAINERIITIEQEMKSLNERVGLIEQYLRRWANQGRRQQ